MERKVSIITEGTEETGFGHYIRCSSLYQAFQDAGDEPIFIINGNEAILPLLNSFHHVVFNWLDDWFRCKKYIEESDIVVIDSYLAGIDFYFKVASIAKIKVFVDDNKRLDFPEGIILNGAIYAADLNYPERGKHLNLIGPEYFLLRKPFQAPEKKIIKKNVHDVMVVLGATDLRNLTPRIIDFLNKKYPRCNKKIVVGPGFRNIEMFNNIKNSKIEILQNIDARKMKAVMLDADLAISACGTTLYELASVGVPTIGVAVADNQLLNANKFSETGFLAYAGWWEDTQLLNNITSRMRNLLDFATRERTSKTGRKLVSGEGCLNVYNYLARVFNMERGL